MRPDGKLLACTRRGEVWLIDKPNAEDPADVKFKLFASGLHEALGLDVEGKDVYVVQRPELTKLVDRDGDDSSMNTIRFVTNGACRATTTSSPSARPATRTATSSSRSTSASAAATSPRRRGAAGASRFRPTANSNPGPPACARPTASTSAPRATCSTWTTRANGWRRARCTRSVKGSSTATRPGLRWVKQSPFAATLKESYPSGMQYDGQPGKNGVSGMPELTPPCIWFPYGRMGQSASEPRWDTTDGKFGPFAGQCFVGDQTKSIVMRVFLEKIGGRYQGACFPFRSGFECGVNRLVFGPDGSLYVGMTNRGWGSLGGKPYGLQRLVYTGVLPFEIQEMRLTKEGFDLTFTKPLDQAAAEKLEAYSLSSFTHYYWGTYGSPELDRKAEKVQAATVAADRKKVSLKVDGFKPGRIYELHLDGDQVGRRRRGAAPGGVLHAEPTAVTAARAHRPEQIECG